MSQLTQDIAVGNIVEITFMAKTVLPETLRGTIKSLSGDGQSFVIGCVDGKGRAYTRRRQIGRIASVKLIHPAHRGCH